MSNLLQMKLVLTACLGLLLAGVAYGQTGTVGSIAGYTSTNFTYGEGTVTNGGLVYVSATFTKPANMTLLGLLAKPTLPVGWSVDWDDTQNRGRFDPALPNSNGSTQPFVAEVPLLWGTGTKKFVFTDTLGWPTLRADIKLNFAVYVPPGDTGDKELSITWYYTTSLASEVPLDSSDNNQPIPDLNVPINQPPERRTMFRFR